MALITLTQAKGHLGITTADGDPTDVMLQLKMDHAEAIILDYLKDQAPDPSPVITAAILIQLAELYRFRGDDPDGPAYEDGQLCPAVTNLLRRKRDPALA